MNAALEVGFALSPVGLGYVRQIVMIVPVGHDLGMDIARGAIKHRLRYAVCSLGRKDPLERCDLSSIGSEYLFKAGERIERSNHFALVAHDRHRSAVWLAIDVGVRRIKIRAGEVVEVARVRRGGPGAAEDFGIVDL